jgi:hypothetical protein
VTYAFKRARPFGTEASIRFLDNSSRMRSRSRNAEHEQSNCGRLRARLQEQVQSKPSKGTKMSAFRDPEPSNADLERYGIERVPADTFIWQGYRYTQARDALAAAKRAEKE